MQALGRPPKTWQDNTVVIAMKELNGSEAAAAEELHEAVAVKDPSHFIRLVGDGMETCRRRTQQNRLAVAFGSARGSIRSERGCIW